MAETLERIGRRPTVLLGLVVAAGLVAAWQLVFGALVGWDQGASLWGAYVLPPLLAAAVPVGVLTARGWWGAPWLVRWQQPQLMLPVLGLGLLLVAEVGVPQGSARTPLLVAFLVTGLSEELLNRGVVQELLRSLAAVPQVVMTGALMAVGYVVTLPLLGATAGKTALIVGMVLGFGTAHAALRRRGTPVPVLALVNALVVWREFASDSLEPLSLVATVIALVYGVWLAADERVSPRAASAASGRTPPAG